MGAAAMGRCTCWEPVYSEPQALPVLPLAPSKPRRGCCGTCGVVDDLTDELGIERSAVKGRPFFCHQGFRRIVEYRHPDGRVRPTGDHDYPDSTGHYTLVNGHKIALKADGTAADLCAAWAKWAREAGHDWFDREEWPVDQRKPA